MNPVGLLVGLTIVVSIGDIRAQAVIRPAGGPGDLAASWERALTRTAPRDHKSGYWMGYSIQRRSHSNSVIGCWYSEPSRNHPTLAEAITGMTIYPDPLQTRSDSTILSDLAILFHLDAGRSVDDMKMSSLSLHVDLERDSLIWLGAMNTGESLDFLRNRFAGSTSLEMQEQYIRAIGLHQLPDMVFGFLATLVDGEYPAALRAEAVFWFSEIHTPEAVAYLALKAETDRSPEVREKAIFALSQQDDEAGTDALIRLASGRQSRYVREKALFSLSEKASRRASETIREIAWHDEDAEIQRQAIYTLTQLPEGATEELIRIATTHPSPRLRKEAIFQLGQSGDPRAVDALVSIIRKK